jgi:hypothetical protein
MKLRSLMLVGICLLVLAAGIVLAAEAKVIERYTAFGVGMQRGAASTIQIVVERWSTPEERQMLVDTLREKGRDALAQKLFKMPRVGWIRLPNTRARDLHYAWQTPQPDGGRRVVVGTDRTLTYAELTTASRSKQYEFCIAEMHFDKDGKGEGKLSPIAKVDVDKETNQVEVENYSIQPVRLLQIKVEKK